MARGGGGLENLAECACTCVNYMSSAEGLTVWKQQCLSVFKFQRVVWLSPKNLHEGALVRAKLVGCLSYSIYSPNLHVNSRRSYFFELQ